jgi:ribosomal protein S18 acetylase RimI-like enzyme
VTGRSPAGLCHVNGLVPRSSGPGSYRLASGLFAPRTVILQLVTVRIDGSLEGIDWARAKADLAADHFDNGRTADALRRSFEQSQHVAIARDGDRVVGMARLLSDGVCNAYLVDVWTASAYRRRGVASAMVDRLVGEVPGQHIGLQTDG